MSETPWKLDRTKQSQREPTYKVRRALAVRLAVALLALERHSVARVVPLLHHEVLHRLGFLLWCQRRARLDLPNLRLQDRLLVL